MQRAISKRMAVVLGFWNTINEIGRGWLHLLTRHCRSSSRAVGASPSHCKGQGSHKNPSTCVFLLPLKNYIQISTTELDTF